MHGRSWRAASIGFATLGLALAFAATPSAGQDRSATLARIWKLFNAGQYRAVVPLAQSCVGLYGRQALRDQQAAASAHEPTPPIGKTDPKSKAGSVTFSRGVLNDASACLFALGRSYQELKQCGQARQVYADLAKLTYARIWDPNGFFWAPSQSAEDQLEELKGRC